MNRSLLVILGVVTLDAIGIGLIFPILPSLLKEVTHDGDVSLLYGVILALYALMQFVFSPVLGALSDRYGRRPVLLISLAGAALDYLIMAFSPFLIVLVVGRMIAGLTSANMAVATAYISDITAERERAKRFGWMSACFGIGFIIGPLAGGLLGETWVRAPFLLAAALNGANLVLALLVLPESRPGRAGKLQLSAFNPLTQLRWALGFQALLPLLAIYTLFGLVGGIPGTIWVLYGHDKFGWDGVTVGLSLTVFGVCKAGAQAFLAGPLTARMGEMRAVILGMTVDGVAFVLIALATQGWMPFAIAPLFALGGIGAPALQSLLANQVGPDKQGELQGVLASGMSLAAVTGPLMATSVYFVSKPHWIGTVWIVGVALYLLATPFILARWRRLELRPAA